MLLQQGSGRDHAADALEESFRLTVEVVVRDNEGSVHTASMA